MSRYITGLLLSPNKTVQGIYAQQVWPEEQPASRRAMHAAVFEAGWDSDELMHRYREVVAGTHRGRGLEVIALDWTYSHHERGPTIYAVKRAYDHVAGRVSRYQTVVTAVVANAEYGDGIAVEIQFPNYQTEELEYLQVTARENYPDLASARQRVLELLHYHKNPACTIEIGELVTRRRVGASLRVNSHADGHAQHTLL
ncbi:MAG: transposase [Candidatus Competibacteraceae bacterium]